MNGSNEVVGEKSFKRHIAYKLRIGQILAGTPILETERLKHLIVDGKNVVRVNVIANIVDKFIQEVQEGGKKYGSVTLDDASGQIKGRFFGDEVAKIDEVNQGDTILVVGLLRSWNNEVYVTPEIMRKIDSRFLLVRKLEADAEQPKVLDREKVAAMKDKILQMVRDAESKGGVNIDEIILELKEPPETINREIKRLLEDGTAYEPRPGKLRYLG